MKTDNLIEIVLPIMQGLLASGHYTKPETDEEPNKILRCDNGKEWNTGLDDDVPLFVRRHTALVIEDAIALAQELKETVALEEMEPERR